MTRLVPRLKTPTTEGDLPWELADLKKAIDVTDDETDAEIALFLRTAFDWLQPPMGCLRVSIATQTLRLDRPGWDLCPLELPAGPVQSIAHIKYFDEINVEQTLDAAHYFLDEDTLLWKDTFPEPNLYERPSAVRITYVAGFGSEDGLPVPTPIKTALMMCVRHWFDNREAVSTVGAMNMMPFGIDDLIANFRQR